MILQRTMPSEWIKLRSVRAHLVVVGAAVGLPVLLAPLIARELAAAAESADLANVVPATTGIGSIILGSLAVMLVTGEHAYGTIDQTLLCTPSMRRLTAAKAAVAALVAIVATGVSSAAALATTRVAVGSQATAIASGGRLAGSLAATCLAAPLLAAAGAAVGTAIRNSSAALTTFLIWTLLEDEILGSILRAVGAGRAVHWLPFTALSEATLVNPDPGAVPRWGALVCFAAGTALVAALVTTGSAPIRRRRPAG